MAGFTGTPPTVSQAIPDEVAALVAERSAARAQRDFALADALRDRIRSMGWEPMDESGGTRLRPLLATAEPDRVGYARAEDLASLLDEPATLAVSLVALAEDHPDDLARFLAGLVHHPPGVAWELILVANAPSYDADAAAAHADLEVTPAVLRTQERLGWADAVNLGLRRSLGETTILLDTSVEPVGDLVTPLLGALSDPTVGIAGGFGLRTADLRRFADAPPGEVEALAGYCLAVRRDALRAVTGFDHHFRFYRNADLDFSFAVRAAGWRAVATEALPLVLHEHRAYASLPAAELDRVSRRNFYRFLRHWGDRRDLLLPS